jgi:GntR family transcriptional regulator
MLFRPNSSSGVPIYLQLMEQVRHAVETGALAPGEQLPGIRKVAEELVINPNTVAKAYRELEHEGVIELRQGAGAFVSERARGTRGRDARAEALKNALPAVRSLLSKLEAAGLAEEEIRRLFEGELARLREGVGGEALERKRR